MKQYRSQLTSQIQALERQRDGSALSVHDAGYDRLIQDRQQSPTIAALRGMLAAAAANVTPVPDAVHIGAIDYDETQKTATVTGDVRFVDVRSMTILSAFVDRLRAMPDVRSVTDPAYVRDDDPKTGPHSPFTVTLVFP